MEIAVAKLEQLIMIGSTSRLRSLNALRQIARQMRSSRESALATASRFINGLENADKFLSHPSEFGVNIAHSFNKEINLIT